MNTTDAPRLIPISSLDLEEVLYLLRYPNNKYQVYTKDKRDDQFHVFELEQADYESAAAHFRFFPSLNLYDGVTLVINPDKVAHTIVEDSEENCLHTYFIGKDENMGYFPIHCVDNSAIKWHVCFQVWNNFNTYNKEERRLDSNGEQWKKCAQKIADALIKTIPECKRAHFFHPPQALQKPQFD